MTTVGPPHIAVDRDGNASVVVTRGTLETRLSHQRGAGQSGLRPQHLVRRNRPVREGTTVLSGVVRYVGLAVVAVLAARRCAIY